jgi:AcrR family transcriptional regulator
MPRSQEQYDEIRKQKKQLIMDTALELFAENGFHATSMSQVAKKAGISKGLAYNYFESKKEILDEIIKAGFDSIFSNFDLNKDGVLTEEEFNFFIQKSFQVLRENLRYWRLYYSITLQSKVAESFQSEYIEKVKPLFSMLHQFAESKGSKDPESDVIAISALLEGSYLFTITASDFFPTDKMENVVIDACFRIINNQKAQSNEN